MATEISFINIEFCREFFAEHQPTALEMIAVVGDYNDRLAAAVYKSIALAPREREDEAQAQAEKEFYDRYMGDCEYLKVVPRLA